MLTDIRLKMANTFRIRCETSSMNNISALKPRGTPCESSSGRLEKYHSIKNKHTLRQLLAGTDRTKWLMARWLSILRKKNLKVYLNFYGKKMKQWKYCFRLNERNSIKFGHTKTKFITTANQTERKWSVFRLAVLKPKPKYSQRPIRSRKIPSSGNENSK